MRFHKGPRVAAFWLQAWFPKNYHLLIEWLRRTSEWVQGIWCSLCSMRCTIGPSFGDQQIVAKCKRLDWRAESASHTVTHTTRQPAKQLAIFCAGSGYVQFVKQACRMRYHKSSPNIVAAPSGIGVEVLLKSCTVTAQKIRHQAWIWGNKALTAWNFPNPCGQSIPAIPC